MSALTISSSFSVPGATMLAPESAAAGDDLTVLAGVTTTATTDDLIARAGDDVIIQGTVQATATGKTVLVQAGYNDSDNAGAITLGATGTLIATNVTLSALTGMTLDGTISAATVDLSTSGGGISQTAPGGITANRLQSSGVTGPVGLGGTNYIAELGNFVATDGFNLADNIWLTIDGTVSAGTHILSITDQIGIETTAASALTGRIVQLISSHLALDLGTVTATDEIILAPYTNGTSVALGAGVSATVALSQAELDNLSAPILTIGRHSGTFTTAGPITIGNASVSSSTLNLYSLGGVTQTAGSLLTVGNGSGTLNITAGGTVMLGSTPATHGVDVGAVGGSTTSGHFFVDGLGAHAMAANAITTAGGEIVVANLGGGLTVEGALTSHGGNVLTVGFTALTLNADIDAGSGAITLGVGGGDITQSTGRLVGTDLLAEVTETAAGSIALTSAGNAISGHVALYAGATGGDISFTNSTAYTIGGFSGITYQSANDTAQTLAGAAIRTSANGAVTLTAGGDITQAGGVNDGIVAGTLSLTRLGGASVDVTLDNALNSIAKLGAVDLGLGALTLVDAHSLTLTAPVVAGSVAITTTAALTVDAPITASGNVTLSARSMLQSAAGTIDTSAVNGDVTLTVTGDPLLVNTIITGSGDVVLNAPAYTILVAALDNIGSLTTDAAGGTVIDGGGVTSSGAQTYHDLVRLGADATLVSHTGGVNIDGALELEDYDLTVSDATTGTFAGVISGHGLFTKAGTGTITLSAANTYTGSTHIGAGTLLVDGSIAESLLTLVASGGTLGGHGAVGDVVVQSGGTLAPGDSPGVLTTGDVMLNAGAHLAIELGGATAGLYDQLQVHGTVNLAGATLDGSLYGGFMPTATQSFTIIDNDGADAVNGTFAGLADGAITNIGGVAFSISYHGGDGNDVTLTALANHAPVNTVPDAQSTPQDTDLSIAGLSVADQDAGSGLISTTLSVAHGTLTLKTGLVELSHNGTNSVMLTGTVAQIDAALAANVTYHPDAGFSGTDTLTIVTDDHGLTGLPGALTDTDTVKINVTAPVPQAPQPIIGTDGNDSFTAAAGSQDYIGLRGVDTMVFDFKLVDAAVTYSGNQIIIDGPNGSHTVMSGIETFVFTDGTVNTRDGSPLIDDLFYYARNHDVWNAHMDADTHFNLYGWREGRDPNAWFDTKGYLSHYADVAAAGVNPLTHYDQYGWHEGRDPSTAFDTTEYLAHYPDVVAKGFDPLAHFLTWQSEEGRQAFGDGVWG